MTAAKVGRGVDRQQHNEPLVLPANADTQKLAILHTSAHVMAMAVQNVFPGTQVTIGPTRTRPRKSAARMVVVPRMANGPL